MVQNLSNTNHNSEKLDASLKQNDAKMFKEGKSAAKTRSAWDLKMKV